MASSNATLLDVLSNTQQPQAYIKTVSDEDASKCPDVQGLYDKWRNADGTLDNVLTIHSCNPTALEAHFQLYKWSVQSVSIARYQGLAKSYCGSSLGRWAILQLLCSQARRKLKEEFPKKPYTKP